jgi:oligosaccharide repeat unit polymerase
MRSAFLSTLKNNIKIILPAALISAAAVFYLNSAFNETLIFGLFVLGLIAGLGILGAYLKNQDILEIIIPVSLFYLSSLGLRALFLVSADNPGISPLGLSFQDHLLPAIFLGTAGLLFLQLGYFSPLGKGKTPEDRSKVWLQKLSSRLQPKTLLYGSLALFIIGQGARTLIMLKGSGLIFNLGNDISQALLPFLNIFTSFQLFGLWGVILFWSACFARKPSRPYIWLGITMTLIEIGFAFISGSKTGLFLLAFGTITAFYYLRRKISPTKVVFLGILIILIIFPVVNSFRNGFIVIYRTTGSIEKALENPFTLKEANGLNLFLRRFHGIDSVALTAKYTPELLPYQNGKTLYPALTAPVPRFLWQNKPKFTYGEWYNQTFWGRPASYTSGIAVYQAGDLYLNFGTPAVLIGLFFMGSLYRFFYKGLIENKECPQPLSIWAYSLISFEILKTQESNLALALGNLFNLLVFLAVAVILILVLQKWLNTKK